MIIQYIEPLKIAWAKMKNDLFTNFDLGKWFVVGFTAFLAGLMDDSFWGGNNFSNKFHKSRLGHENFDSIKQSILDWMTANPGWVLFIICAIATFIILLIVLTWLSSRGKFMFLDNVVHNKAEVKNGWKNYKEVGNSLFLWRLGFGLTILFAFLLISLIAFYTIKDFYHEKYVFAIFTIIIGALIVFVIFVTAIYISVFLTDFIVPIMYKTKKSTTEAWNIFLPVLKENIISFIIYGLFLLVLYIAVFISIVIVGFLTCCLGFVILIIPYISTVLLLPLFYWKRSFSVIFLEQMGEKFKILPKGEVKVKPEQVG